jgi:hypothetical protein
MLRNNTVLCIAGIECNLQSWQHMDVPWPNALGWNFSRQPVIAGAAWLAGLGVERFPNDPNNTQTRNLTFG